MDLIFEVTNEFFPPLISTGKGSWSPKTWQIKVIILEAEGLGEVMVVAGEKRMKKLKNRMTRRELSYSKESVMLLSKGKNRKTT